MRDRGKERVQARDEGCRRVALVGAPNVGKSVLFGLLTGKYATVSNYPGTTVEVTYGNLQIDGTRFLVVDTPGVNSLTPMSEDEQVTRDIILRERPALVVQVGDAKNLKRTLALTAQLAEMGLPVVLALNMQDEARERGIKIDTEKLGELIGVEVVATVAPERKGLKELKAAIHRGIFTAPRMDVPYPPAIEECAGKVVKLLPKANISRRSLALMVLSGDETLAGWLKANVDRAALEEIEAIRDECEARLKRPVSAEVGEARMRAAGWVADKVTERTVSGTTSLARLLGTACMHPVCGLPLLAAVLFGLYEFVGVLGADILVGFVEETLFGEYLNPMFIRVVYLLVPVPLFRDMLVGEYGLITMALTYAIGIILPITTTFFIAFSVLEDSGYLPRLAIMSNRVFNLMGLSGKAVLPMVLGLGCGTMAVMTTRILETRRDRLIATFLLALAVPCAAQLGVIMGMIGSLSATAMGVWAGCVLGVLLLSGHLASKIVKGEKADFFLEIPPIRLPSIENVLVKTWGRAVWYLKEAVPLFMLGTFALFVLDRIKVLAFLEWAASPVIVGVLGLPPKAAEAFLIGFFRRDYGAAGLYAMNEAGLLEPVQVLVSLVTLTLFVPCLAHFFMMIKERGMRQALTIMAIIVPTALAVGGVLNFVLRHFDINV